MPEMGAQPIEVHGYIRRALTSEVSTATRLPVMRPAVRHRYACPATTSQQTVASTAQCPEHPGARPAIAYHGLRPNFFRGMIAPEARPPMRCRRCAPVEINLQVFSPGQLPGPPPRALNKLYERLEVREPDLNQRILGTGKGALLRVSNTVSTLTVARVQLDLRDLVGAPVAFGRPHPAGADTCSGRLLGGHQGILDV